MWEEAHSCTFIEPKLLDGVNKEEQKSLPLDVEKVPERVNDIGEPIKYHNDVPSFFCESELLNYNIITQK